MELILVSLVLAFISFVLANEIDNTCLELQFNARVFSDKCFYEFKEGFDWWLFIPIYNLCHSIQNFRKIKKEYKKAGVNPFDKEELMELAIIKEKKRRQQAKSIQRTSSHEFTQKFGEVEEKWIEIKPNIDVIQINAGTLKLHLGSRMLKTDDIVYLPDSKFMDYSYQQNKLELNQISSYEGKPVHIYIIGHQDKRYQLELNTDSCQILYPKETKLGYEPIDIDTLHQKQKTFQINKD